MSKFLLMQYVLLALVFSLCFFMNVKKSTVGDSLNEQVLLIRRVSKKTTGGNYSTFSALVAVGDGKGNVGLGIAKDLEVPPAIKKAIVKAKKSMVPVSMNDSTIKHQIFVKYKASRILLKPAPKGTGLKVGGVVRVILELAGVQDVSGKIIGSRNHISNAYAVFKAIGKLKKGVN